MKQFLEFRQLERPDLVTVLYDVHSAHDGSYLGRIRWSFGWRQYVVDTADQTQWSSKCLIQLGEFLDKLNAEHKARGFLRENDSRPYSKEDVDSKPPTAEDNRS